MLQFIGMMVAGLICNKAHSPRICLIKDNYIERRMCENVANESSQRNMSLYI